MSAKDERFNPPDYQFRPFWESLAVGIVIFVAVTHANYFLYDKALLAQKGEINDGLAMFSTVIAAYVNDENHKALVHPDQEHSELYNQTLVPLEILVAANDSIVNVYTMVQKGEDIYFILDPTPEGDRDNDGQDDKAHLLELYENPPKELQLAFETGSGQVTAEPYIDKWGNYFSSFSPLMDEQGEIYGMLGLDVSASGYHARLKPIQRHYLRSTAASFFVAFVIGCVIWFLRQFSAILHKNRQHIITHIHKERRAQTAQSPVPDSPAAQSESPASPAKEEDNNG